MATKKIKNIKIMDKNKLRKIGIKKIKDIIEGPYDLPNRNFEVLDDRIEWNSDDLVHEYHLNINLVQNYYFKTFFDKETGELIGMFDGYCHDYIKKDIGVETTKNLAKIQNRVQMALKLPPEAKLNKKRVFNLKENDIELLKDVELPFGRYVRFEWRHRYSKHFKENKNREIKNKDVENKYIEAYYNLELDKIIYYFKNW